VPNIELSKAARADPGLLAGLQPLLDQVARDQADRPDLVRVFADALAITLATTVRPFAADGTTFVATGDIAAMWLRDSSAQVETYLRVAEHNPGLRRVLEGVTRRQAAFMAVDPYANAFNEQPADGHHGTDTPQPGHGSGSGSTSWTRCVIRSGSPTACGPRARRRITSPPTCVRCSPRSST
jgi:hypothetical protein